MEQRERGSNMGTRTETMSVNDEVEKSSQMYNASIM